MFRTCSIILLIGLALSVNGQNQPSDFLSSDFHKERREKLRKKLPDNSVAIFFANPVRNRANDVDFKYHQDPNFHYLTGYPEPHAVLLIFKENQTAANGSQYNEILFVQPRDPQSEMWTGRRLGPDGVKTTLGFDQAFNNVDFLSYNIDFSSFKKIIFEDFKNDVRNTDEKGDLYDLIESFKVKVNYPKEQTSLQIEPSAQNLDFSMLRNLMSSLRGVKTEEEVDMVRKAVSISTVGQVEVMKAMKPGMSELEVQGIHEFVFKKYGAEYEGYPSIVGAGNNGCILHYIDNYKPKIENSEMILMDLGAEYHGYTADVTRTIPVSGTFSKEQKIIYDLVYKAQEKAMQSVKPGVEMSELYQITYKVIARGLMDLDIIKNETEARQYYPHGCCHHIGLDVHDLGARTLEKNMIITVEPGIYIPEGSACDKKWWGLAVRIEDDVLVTSKGFELLSGYAPRKSDEIELIMKENSLLEGLILPDLNSIK